jgi:hypothetical protein
MLIALVLITLGYRSADGNRANASVNGGASTELQRDPRSALILTVVDTLVETENEYVGRVQAVTVAPDRSILITDQFSRRIVRFGPGRDVRRMFGRSGDGPGEFQGPLSVAVVGRDSVVVADVTNQSVSLFAQMGGLFIRRLHTPGIPRSLSAGPKRLFVSSYSVAANTAVATWPLAADTLRRWLALPLSITRNKLAMRAWQTSVLASRADTVAVGFTPSNEILIAADGAEPADRFILPAKRRRAIPADLDAALAPVAATPGRLTLIPTLDGLYWRPDSLLLVWHKDWIAPSSGVTDFQRAATQATLHAFVSVVDRAKRRACVDIAIPTDWAENPALTAAGDLFYVVGHEVDARGKPTLEVRRFRFDLTKCDWVPLQ